MNCFLKTCFTEILLLAGLAAPLVLVGCDHPADPPVEPRSAAPSPPQVLAQGDPTAAEPAPAPADRAGDAALTARVKAALLADDEVKGLAIDVDTRAGEVTLRGTVERPEAAARAVEVASGVEGVREVVNRLTVKGENQAAESTKG